MTIVTVNIGYLNIQEVNAKHECTKQERRWIDTILHHPESFESDTMLQQLYVTHCSGSLLLLRCSIPSPNLYNTQMDVDVYQCLKVALFVECALRTEYQFMHLTHTITYTNTMILVLVIKLHCYWYVVLLQVEETWRWQWMSKSSLVRNTTAMSCWLGSMNLYRPGSRRWSKHAQVG